MPHDLTFRFLRPEDAGRLADFFKAIPEATRRVYGPHHFDEVTAEARCRAQVTDDDLSIIAVDESGEVLAYCVYRRGFCPSDLERNGYHVRAYDADDVVTVAPCVKEGIRGGGMGGMLLRYAAYEARREGRKALVLFGGVRSGNIRALKTYLSVGFRFLGFWEHPNCPANYDMACDLVRPGKDNATGADSHARKTSG